MGIPLILSQVPFETPYIQYVSGSLQTVFPYPFAITQDSDLVVVVNGVTLPTDGGYSLSGQGNATGGNVTFAAGQTAGAIVTVFRDIPIERISQIAQNSGFSSTVFNAEFNNIYLIMQQIEAQFAQVLQIPNTNPGSPQTTLTPGSYANKYLAFDSNGNPTPALLTSSGSITAALLGGLIYPRTGAEIAAAVVPTAFQYPPGNVLRYGAAGNGVTDDSSAIQTAFTVASQVGGPTVVLPAGFTFKISSYVQVFGNTTAHIYGAVQLTNRASGLYVNGSSNIGIYGFKLGSFQDSTIAAVKPPSATSTYIWNNNNVNVSTPVAPAIHVRSGTNVTIDGLNFSYVNQGVLISNATANTSPASSWTLSQAVPAQCTVRDCNFQYVEMAGIAGYNCVKCLYRDNYVYRSGDGGIWHMGGTDCQVIGNVRLSPYATPVGYSTYGPNNEAQTTSWNDEQGMQFESCIGLLIQNNVVDGFWAQGLSIKNGCTRVLCSGNQIRNCENAGIATYQGDGVNNPCAKISIVGNTITGQGYQQFGVVNATYSGCIFIDHTFSCEILDNVIYSYNSAASGNFTPGINCLGPGAYLNSFFSGNPHQAKLVVSGNQIDFKNNTNENDSNDFNYTQYTQTAISVSGYYDSVHIVDNTITTDYYASSDTRNNTTPAITLSYLSANSTYYPTNAKIDSNTIDGWGGTGILVNGLIAMTSSNLSVCNNSIGVLGEPPFISLNNTNFANVSGNTCAQCNAGGAPGISVAGTAGNLVNGVIVNNNSITGGWQTGGNSLTYGISLSYCAGPVSAAHNRVSTAVSGTIQVANCTGDIYVEGTLAPRSGAGSPQGAVTSYYTGEPYLNTTTPAWFFAVSGNSTNWDT